MAGNGNVGPGNGNAGQGNGNVGPVNPNALVPVNPNALLHNGAANHNIPVAGPANHVAVGNLAPPAPGNAPANDDDDDDDEFPEPDDPRDRNYVPSYKFSYNGPVRVSPRKSKGIRRSLYFY